MGKPETASAFEPARRRKARALAAVVLAAGQGTRMKSRKPKVLHEVAGRSMLGHALAAAGDAGAKRTVVVAGKDMEAVAQAAAPARVAVQDPPLGTGHAVLAARKALGDFAGDILVIYADTPLLSGETLKRLAAERAHADIVVLGFEARDPKGYGRLVVGASGTLNAIVEEKDASAVERTIRLCNSGVMIAGAAALFTLLGEVKNDNAQREYYLTDIVRHAHARNLRCAVVVCDEAEVMGVNSRAELARAEAAMQQRLRARAMAEGATLLAPETVYFSFDTKLGRDVTVGQNVVFGPGVRVGDGVSIRAFCHLEGATVEEGAVVGPFARLRPGSVVGRNAHIGNFVETKNAKLGEGAKANHLAYLGDARIGARANIGAGTITCNYDGFGKYRTEIGKDAFIGSNAALVAPVRIGDGAYVGAGSVIARDVKKDALAIARSEQKQLPGWAARFRAKKRKSAKRGKK